jgi:hypothetical protein
MRQSLENLKRATDAVRQFITRVSAVRARDEGRT